MTLRLDKKANDLFETDKEALEEAVMTIETEGIGNFMTKANKEAKAAEPELQNSLIHGKIQPAAQEVQDMIALLSDEKLEELDQFVAT